METTNLEVDSNDLMERIRRAAADDVSRPRAQLTVFDPGETHATISAVPAVDHLQPKALRSEKIATLLARARTKTTVNPKIPKFLRRLFRKQGGYNEIILEVASVLMRMIESLHAQSRATASHLEAQTAWLDTFARTPEFIARSRAKDRATISAAFSDVEELRNRLARLEARQAHDKQMLERELEQSATVIEQLKTELAARTGESHPRTETRLDEHAG